ncbi:MAG: sugar phosphate isomerase/epimerase [Bacteroidota bacterium]|nr:sugar phosphate isomerase/epimerase [Bacteroidota bacterium]
MNRRELIKSSTAAILLPQLPNLSKKDPPAAHFRFCLNTSTIMGQKPGLIKSIEIAAAAGYDGVELWMMDIQDYLSKGGSTETLAKLLQTKKLKFENAISFTEWLVDDDTRRQKALVALEEEMKIVATIGGKRIAAPPAGLAPGQVPELTKAGERYREILQLGRKHGVMPLLEFWGASGSVDKLPVALAIAAEANDPDARILPDVYHLFRGGSGFDGLRLLNGHAIDIIHANDYPGGKPVGELTDADRVYPGDGVAPYKKILDNLRYIGGTKVLSLELFNAGYWKEDPLAVAKTGLAKMKKLVNNAQ